MEKKNANLIYIEECFLNIQNHNNQKENLKTVKRFVNRMFSNCECTDVIITNNKGTLFGMNVFPSSKTIYEFMRGDGKSKVPQHIEYVIEIDSKLFFDKALNLTAPEIVAILLHEVGHVVANSSFLCDLRMLYIETATKKGINLNDGVMKDYNDVISELFIYNFIEKTKINNLIKNFESEVTADDFAVKQGYGKELYSVLSKFAKYYRVPIEKQKSKKQVMNDFDREADLLMEMVKTFENRKAFIEQSLRIQQKMTTSEVFKEKLEGIRRRISNIVNMMNDTILGRKKQALEQNSLNEGFITKLLNLTPRISQKDIDELKIECQMIETNDDKLYIIRKIHSKLSDVSIAMDKLKHDKYKLGNLVTYKKQLDDLLESTLKKTIEEKTYGVFVKYPKGYEG